MFALKTMIPILALAGGVFTSTFLGAWNPLILTLLCAIAIDYLTGLVASAIEGRLSSSAGFKGILKKIIIFSIVAAAHFLDLILKTNDLLRDATILFYLCNEIISILENAGRAGLPLPDFIKDKIEMLKKKNKKE
ncbi:phage holin family protein [Falsibacillus pallidus]|uniref:Cph1 family holin n=1 Tax=Falsibacillus pallidus TaxID=493781 RepID=A0A370GPG2_9BACI|nr:phage holin family protein [Falsibacillus pallidus]RDI44364.1 Cph1 family holin [Falsibacillus pallidus]